MGDKNKVNKYLPKNRGMIHAVQWTGKVECLMGLPSLNEVIVAIDSIDSRGLMAITCDGDEDLTNVRPFKDFVVIDQFGKLVVFTQEAMKENFDMVEVPEIPSGPIKRVNELIIADRPEEERDNRVGRTVTIIEADRPDDT